MQYSYHNTRHLIKSIEKDIKLRHKQWGKPQLNDFEWLAKLFEQCGSVAETVCTGIADNFSLDSIELTLDDELVKLMTIIIDWLNFSHH